MKQTQQYLICYYLPSLKYVAFCFLFLFFTRAGLAQSPKKYFKHGYYEQAFVEAAYKQNKKVKLKEKYTSIIYQSYDIIYLRHSEIIASPETDWESSYTRLIRMGNFRAKVKHPGVYNNLQDISMDSPILDALGEKFNESNQRSMAKADTLEAEGNFNLALLEYKTIKKRHLEAQPLSTLEKRLIILDFEGKINNCHQKIGDQYIKQAREELAKEEPHANTIIALVTAAKGHRPLSPDEEGLLHQGKLIKADSWIKEAYELMAAGTKQSMRSAFELINDVRYIRNLSPEEEKQSKHCEKLGTTNVLVKLSGNPPIHTTELLTGILNERKSSKWLAFYEDKKDGQKADFILEVSETEPNIQMGKLQKEITQNTKTVEYYEEVTDANGKVTKVKKTRQAVAVIAKLRRDKTAELKWTLSIKDLSDENPSGIEEHISEIIVTKESASFVSGDILAAPEKSDSGVDFNSQPFPTDPEIRKQIIEQYRDELWELIKKSQLQNQNINNQIKD